MPVDLKIAAYSCKIKMMLAAPDVSDLVIFKS